ncbi:Non-repetitive/WGA-negative nucleoporin C-terminal-domain-containing protein [Lophiotrema nucula]|uniref:Non-repetitive/WGA-negative nucleoporin C-terminal-domain-containing protein n=1 Tax=Lophiotrema nucula TaxID=690887 RepID=A0A6A5ZHG9_9PLEO|nr:Non-repetitive/WGA-negative nucleoporin C-terminal-domain-containing protein [Lophiotrema nucula]
MFSPEATISSARSSLRNPRRRQRKDSDGLKEQPRRKRSKLSQEVTADSPPHIKVNGNGRPIQNGHVSHHEVENSMVLVDMPVRDRKPAKRGSRDDSAAILTKNENYSFKRLPGFPPLLANSSTPFRAFPLPSAGLALALTSSQAFVWDYTSTNASPKVVTLPLSFNLKASDPLPVGAVVRNGPTNDFGILAIAPSSGRVTFWDNVETAEARSHLSQRHQSVEGVVSKMYSGEIITDIVDIEHAGYILIFSTGRLAQLTLRDSQGRPSISTHFVQGNANTGGSFFSFKGLLGSGIRQSIASVKARPSELKGQMEVVAATRNGVFKLWEFSWSGQQVFRKEVDVHDEMLSALQIGTTPETHGQQEAHILDFAIVAGNKEERSLSFLVLVALSGRNALDYSLLELVLSDNSGIVTRAIPIRNFNQPQLPRDPSGTLVLPTPAHTAFIHFPDALVVASLAEHEDDAEAQLLSDSGSPSLPPFQDTIYFSNERHVHITGQAPEHSSKLAVPSSAVFFVQDFGVCQLSALPPASDDDDMGRRKITAKSKLEQSTFYSTVPNNIVDFSVASRYSFGEEEVEAAAMAISDGILASSYDALEKVTSSMDEQLRKRCSALRTLISTLRAEYPPLSTKAKWYLLWHGEKMAAALQLWRRYEERLQAGQADLDTYREMALWPQLVRVVHEKFKTKIRPELGETDAVRQYFLRDIGKLEVILPWAWQLIRTFYMSDKKADRPGIMERLTETNQILLTAYETAFAFREENAEIYGINPNDILNGILKPECGYDLIPHPWTSIHNLVNAVRSVVDVGRTLAIDSFEEEFAEDLAKKLAQDNPRLVEVDCQIHIERFTWLSEQSEERRRASGKSVKEDFNKHVRPDQIFNLVNIGLAAEGMRIAEKFHDMTTLARLVWNETQFLEESKETTQSKMERYECEVKLKRMKEQVQHYFQKFGDPWARAYYSKFIKEQETGALLTRGHFDRRSLTKFLRSDPSRARLAWINEVLTEKDYKAAGHVLIQGAASRENNSWCKKVELSVAKLALLAKKESMPEDEAKAEVRGPSDVDDALAEASRQLQYSKILDQLYERFEPDIKGAMDDEAAVQLLMEQYAQGRLRKRPHLRMLLQQGFEHMVHNRVLDPALLIDVLTLMTDDQSDPLVDGVYTNDFALALRALALSWHDMDKTTRHSTSKLIWKRVLMKDDWASINDTKDVSDEQLTEILVNTATGQAFKALVEMLEERKAYSVVWPKPLHELFGGGVKDSDLCTRFGADDLRKDIIKENLDDEGILQVHAEKHRLDLWFQETAKAAQRQVELEKAEAGQHQQQSLLIIEPEEPYINGGMEPEIDESLEVAASEAFEGDDEQSVADQDIDMEDA